MRGFIDATEVEGARQDSGLKEIAEVFAEEAKTGEQRNATQGSVMREVSVKLQEEEGPLWKRISEGWNNKKFEDRPADQCWAEAGGGRRDQVVEELKIC